MFLACDLQMPCRFRKQNLTYDRCASYRALQEAAARPENAGFAMKAAYQRSWAASKQGCEPKPQRCKL